MISEKTNSFFSVSLSMWFPQFDQINTHNPSKSYFRFVQLINQAHIIGVELITKTKSKHRTGFINHSLCLFLNVNYRLNRWIGKKSHKYNAPTAIYKKGHAEFHLIPYRFNPNWLKWIFIDTINKKKTNKLLHWPKHPGHTKALWNMLTTFPIHFVHDRPSFIHFQIACCAPLSPKTQHQQFHMNPKAPIRHHPFQCGASCTTPFPHPMMLWLLILSDTLCAPWNRHGLLCKNS